MRRALRAIQAGLMRRVRFLPDSRSMPPFQSGAVAVRSASPNYALLGQILRRLTAKRERYAASPWRSPIGKEK